MALKPMKSYSALLIKEMQIKTSIRDPLSTIRLRKIKGAAALWLRVWGTGPGWQEGGQEWEAVAPLGRTIVQPLCRLHVAGLP